MGRSAGNRTRTTRRPPDLPTPNALTASAVSLNDLKRPVITNRAWQAEAWDYYTQGGELWFAINWKANALSRVRLRAAKLSADSAEPEFVDEGPAAQIVARLAGGVGGQAALMRAFGLQLGVAGEGNLITYDRGGVRGQLVEVKSNEDVRVKPNSERARGGKQFEVRVAENKWDTLPRESLVVRIWDPDPRESWQPTSTTRACLIHLREIDFYNRKIIAQLLSRLASNGFLLIPEEVTFPVNPQFAEAPDPFIAELINIASQAIKNPGTASAALPIPLRVPAQFIEVFRHLTFANEIPESDLANRERAIQRLAATLDLPQEVVTGLGDTNHWNAAALDEEGVKKHIAPPCEIICQGLTEGYLYPMLDQADDLDLAEGERYVVWYDTTALTARPDLSQRGVELSDKTLIDDEAARREAGFDESDAPEPAELQKQLVRQRFLAGGTFDQPTIDAINFLTGLTLPFEAAPPPPQLTDPGQDDEEEPDDDEGAQGRTTPPDPDDDGVQASIYLTTAKALAGAGR